MSIRQRLYPTAAQAAGMVEHCDHARFVYNMGLDQRRRGRGDKTLRVSVAAQMRTLTAERGQRAWLRAGSTVIQQGALRDLDRAFTNFFAKRAKPPTFRSSKDARQGFVVRDVSVRRIGARTAAALVPKVGWVRLRLTRDWHDLDAATSARVHVQHGRWHVALTTPPPPKRSPGTGEVLGIDRGVANSIATSEGAFYQAPTLTAGEKRRFVALERRAARQDKGSKRRARTKASLGALHRRLGDRRRDWVEQTTTGLARRYDLVALEDLSTRNMTRRAAPKPDPEAAGAFLRNNARAKSGLNRAILASCWGAFAIRLADKTTVVLVDPRCTSQACNACGHVAPENRESQAVFRCVSCGHVDHADTNAARNILARGLTTPPNPVTPGDRTCQSRSTRAAGRVNHQIAA